MAFETQTSKILRRFMSQDLECFRLIEPSKLDSSKELSLLFVIYGFACRWDNRNLKQK